MSDGRPQRSADWLALVFPRIAWALGRVEVRLLLSVAIITSLLPFGWVTDLDAFFLGLFSVEFLFRALLVFRGEGKYAEGSQSGVTPTEAELQDRRDWEWPRISTLILLIFDLLALLSFVPSLLGDHFAGAEQTRWLRLFRLSRMLLLLGYWAPLVRDVWVVLLRRERAKQVVLMGFIVLALSFAGAVVIDQLQVTSDQVIDFNGDDEITDADNGFLV
ncbi:MAG: hypothetical protein KC431_03625, partial [Myxococcales bacterium]|nr:hypothetical protein [Myxococcales bacterium]